MKKGDIGHSSALYVWNGFSLFWGTSFHTSPHHHDTLQLVFDIDRNFKVKDQYNDWKEYSTLIIRDGHTHQMDSNGSIQLFLYLDKHTAYAKQLTAKYLQDSDMSDLSQPGVRALSYNFFKQLLVESDCEHLFQGCSTILRHLIDIDIAISKDTRVEKAVSFITQAKETQITVKEVARHVCLSESRLRYLFKKSVGQPIQNFILWMKIVDSLQLIVHGNKVEDTAFATGFWDAAHMNRSYKALLGVTPGTIQQLDGAVKIIACGSKNLYHIQTTIQKSWGDTQPSAVIRI